MPDVGLLVEEVLAGTAAAVDEALAEDEAEGREAATWFKGSNICELEEIAEMSIVFPPIEKLSALHLYRPIHRKL